MEMCAIIVLTLKIKSQFVLFEIRTYCIPTGFYIQTNPIIMFVIHLRRFCNKYNNIINQIIIFAFITGVLFFSISSIYLFLDLYEYVSNFFEQFYNI